MNSFTTAKIEKHGSKKGKRADGAVLLKKDPHLSNMPNPITNDFLPFAKLQDKEH